MPFTGLQSDSRINRVDGKTFKKFCFENYLTIFFVFWHLDELIRKEGTTLILLGTDEPPKRNYKNFSGSRNEYPIRSMSEKGKYY